MKSFSCSKVLLDSLLEIFEKLSGTYYAHLSKDKLEKETLFEHSTLVSKYCLRLMESHGINHLLDLSIEKLLTLLQIKSEKEWGNLLKEIFLAAIVYHDLGKINPNFQSLKMENEEFSFDNKLSFQSYHSFLGAYLFSNIYFKKIFKNEKLDDENEKLILYFVTHLFAGAIIKHHSPSINFSLEFDSQQIEDCYSFLKTYCIFWEENNSLSFYQGATDIYAEITEKIDNPVIYFNIFAVTKLLYSLLTASDFYATNEFMSKIEIIEFGTLSKEEKAKLTERFKTVKPYNKDLYLNFEHYQSFPFEKLTERNNQNLNILRQKLTAEMIFNLRNHSEKRCFYLEAPTGAGKTNLSLAFATELMNVDPSLNKVFYVFPFTTLITQTFKSIKETLEIDNNTIIQLHSKDGFHEKEEGTYGNEKRLYLDNLFVNYPIALMSHIRFFDILKGNIKESNYLLHRLCNSVVIIDEIQTYDPEHWDKIVYFLSNYAELFNIRVLIMSATLPKIDALHENLKGSFISLVTNREQYFTNQNFAGRVSFDFTWADKKRPDKAEKENYLRELSDFMIEKAEHFASFNEDKVKVLIEFITKKTAALFFSLLKNNNRFEDYKILLLSGDILEFRRQQIINSIKELTDSKVVVVSTQVVESGVDIDMDLGFKDRSLLDSDEQLAGRVNRNASKTNCVVYLFDCDKTSTIYGSDSRYKIQQTSKDIFDDYKKILVEKKFHALYEKVFEEKRKKMKSLFFAAGQYYYNFKEFDFSKLHRDFTLIENNDSQQLFIPIQIPISFFDNVSDLIKMDLLTEDLQFVDGVKVFELYIKLITWDFEDFTMKQIEMKKIGSIMSQFSISVYRKQLEAIADMLHPEKNKYGFQYLLNWDLAYSPEYGFDSIKIDTSVFL